ncbi:HAD family hydrolase [Seohaeicola zhoushanensis]
MTIDALIFDKDGTLFDFTSTWARWAEGLLLRIAGDDRARAIRIGQEIGFDLSAHRFEPGSLVIANTPHEIAAVMSPLVPEMTEEALFDLINAEAEIVTQAEVLPLVPFFEGLRRRGLRLGLATNDTEAPALAHLEAAGVRELFDFIAGCDSGHGAKPGPGQLLAFASAIGVDPRESPWWATAPMTSSPDAPPGCIPSAC